jgi:hypothetical protein
VSWRYSVFPCTNKTDDHNTCEAFGGPPSDILWDDRWRDAFRKAEDLPHAIVVREYRGELGWSKKSFTVFEHVEGGATCFYCRKSRGPLCKTPEGNRFMCDSCKRLSRDLHERNARAHGTDPDRWFYVPIIDTLDWEAQ